MSDIPPLELLDSYLQWKLSIESVSLAYAVESTKKDVLLALDIPFPLLKAWHSLVVLKVARYSSWKSGKHMFQIQNIVH